MLAWLSALPIQRAIVLGPVYLLAGVLLVLCLLPFFGVRGRRLVRVGWIAAAAGIGALLGWLAVYFVVDVEDVFGAPADDVIRAAAAGSGAAVAVGVTNLVRTRWWRKTIGIVLVAAALCSAGLVINRDVSYYPTLGDFIGDTTPTQIVIGNKNNAKEQNLTTWRGPKDLPTSGEISLATIPGTLSHFRARQAWVYRPPAALVKNPPKLPVVIALAGQPGGPSDVFQAGGLGSVLDAIAAAHHGVAPIVIAADQLGAYNVNPMCVNSRMGNVATYITQDVRDWALKNLPVSANRREWSVMGFSEGATCAVQFGAQYHAIFGSFVAVSPELGPIDGTLARTLREAFKGSRKAWEAAQPIAIMQRNKSYKDTRAIYSVGAADTRYGADAPKLYAESKKVGMQATFDVLPGVAHNWNTGALGFQDGLADLLSWWGIT